jgi:hypothetical protein
MEFKMDLIMLDQILVEKIDQDTLVKDNNSNNYDNNKEVKDKD